MMPALPRPGSQHVARSRSHGANRAFRASSQFSAKTIEVGGSARCDLLWALARTTPTP
jgi:hypothetical protein